MGLKCPECHFENLDNSRFCSRCATPLISIEEPSHSPTQTLETPITGLTRWTTFAKRYDVIEELDKGGMGKIYKVFDKKLEQEVALKLIKPEIASDQDTIKRFKNELKSARNISHRNVCRMYDLGQEGSAYYITMEHISGENLKNTIRRVEKLTFTKAISITKQICEGLSEAHRLGVVHRDLKPGNIMLDIEGNARILDFGIARSIKSSGMTGAGVMIGTPEYMSPEQVEGEEADNRSDIYSLGVILYEMVTGQVPFHGDTPLSVAVKHKLETPRNPRELNPQIPEDLNRLILRCLEKNKERRYQSTESLLSDLNKIENNISMIEKVSRKKKRRAEKTTEIRWKMALLRGLLIGGGLIVILLIALVYYSFHIWRFYRPQKTIDAIAVLPLKNLSGKSDLDYLAERMTEALIDEITRTGTLRRVPPATSIMQYKPAPKRLAEIAKELDIESVVEWSMFLEGKQLQIKVKLIEASKEQVLWDKIYEREMRDDLSLQSEIPSLITQEIMAKISGQELKYPGSRPVNPKALELYNKGRFFWAKRPEKLNEAERYLDHAIDEDPKFALAYASLAEINIFRLQYNHLYSFYPKDVKDYYERAIYDIEKALKIDKFIGVPHASLAWIKMCYERNWEEAEKEFQLAIQRSPKYSSAHQWYGNYLMYLGQFEEALKEIERALELEPDSPFIESDLGLLFYYTKQYDKAIEVFQRLLKKETEFSLAHLYLGLAYLQNSRYEDALAEFEKKQKTMANWKLDARLCSWMGIAYSRIKKEDKMRDMMAELQKRSKSNWSVPYSLACLCFAIGKNDEGFEWLKKAYEFRDYQLCLLKIDPLLDNARGDPRFNEMLKTMKFQ